MLWAASVLCFVAFGVSESHGTTTVGSNKYENLIVGVALVLVVLITATFSFVQTVKSSDAMAGFARMAPQVLCSFRLLPSLVNPVILTPPPPPPLPSLSVSCKLYVF